MASFCQCPIDPLPFTSISFFAMRSSWKRLWLNSARALSNHGRVHGESLPWKLGQPRCISLLSQSPRWTKGLLTCASFQFLGSLPFPSWNWCQDVWRFSWSVMQGRIVDETHSRFAARHRRLLTCEWTSNNMFVQVPTYRSNNCCDI